jgi:hypothetical protein
MERFDSYMFISLGEVVIGSQIDPTSPKHSIFAYALSALLLFLGFQFKIIYSEMDPRFERGGCHAMERNRLSRFGFVMIQYPLNAAVVSLSFLFEEMIHIKVHEKDERELEGYMWRLAGSVGLVVLLQTALQLLHRGSGRKLRLVPKELRLVLRLVVAAFIVTMPITMKILAPNEFVLLLTGVHLLLVLLDLIGRVPRDRSQWNEGMTSHSGACPNQRFPYQHKHAATDHESRSSSNPLLINDSEGTKEDTPLLPPT